MENDEHRARPGPTAHLDIESLKALAHPLRVQILDTLSIYGEFTASGLAERLGESSGATSYHLRQLERHGFVREVEGKGTGRERWWERVPGGITLNATEIDDTPGKRAATKARSCAVGRQPLASCSRSSRTAAGTSSAEEWFTATTVIDRQPASSRATSSRRSAMRGSFHRLAPRQIPRPDRPGAPPRPDPFQRLPRRSEASGDIMTATTARMQAHGLDRVVIKVSLSMLMWARQRAAGHPSLAKSTLDSLTRPQTCSVATTRPPSASLA